MTSRRVRILNARSRWNPGPCWLLFGEGWPFSWDRGLDRSRFWGRQHGGILRWGNPTVRIGRRPVRFVRGRPS